ncbi:MAG: hypothetical protein WBM23_10600 [Desulfomonilia bacterium]
MGFNIKKILSYSIIIVLSLAAGWSYGVFTTLRENIISEIPPETGTIITTDISVLKYMRNGETQKAIEFIEQDLDAHIIKFYLGIPGDDMRRYVTETTLKRAKKYRQQYPWSTNNKEIDQMVNEVLSRVDITNWKGN